MYAAGIIYDCIAVIFKFKSFEYLYYYLASKLPQTIGMKPNSGVHSYFYNAWGIIKTSYRYWNSHEIAPASLLAQ
jgi:hypothetical protein